MDSGNKFNENIQVFSPEQVSRIFDELKIGPLPTTPLKAPKAASKKHTAVPSSAAPEQRSIEDILKSNFIEEEQE